MGLLQRIALMFKGKANRAVDRLEDPGEALDLAYARQVDALQRVKRSVADVVTSQKQLEIQLRQIKAGHAKLEDLARRAVKEDREDLAASALTQGEMMAGQIGGLETQIEQLVSQRENLEATAQRLQTRVASMRTSKESFKAQYGAAKASAQAGEAVVGLGKDQEEIEQLLERAREKMVRTQARAEAMTELMESGSAGGFGTSPESIEGQLDAHSIPAAVSLRIAELKRELSLPPAESTAPPALEAAPAEPDPEGPAGPS
jgi:phage shock protein A